jgi:hypothetical protein
VGKHWRNFTLHQKHTICCKSDRISLVFWLVEDAIAAEQRVQMLEERRHSLGVNPDSLA